MSPRGLGVAASLAIALIASVSRASPSYPEGLQKDLSLSYAPACSLCHAEATKVDAGAADTPFDGSLVARGLKGGDAADTLKKALDAMRADGVDSDGDGARDLDELSWRGDPNHYDGPLGSDITAPEYGCAFSPASRAPFVAFVFALALVALAFARRRSRSLR